MSNSFSLSRDLIAPSLVRPHFISHQISRSAAVGRPSSSLGGVARGGRRRRSAELVDERRTVGARGQTRPDGTDGRVCHRRRCRCRRRPQKLEERGGSQPCHAGVGPSPSPAQHQRHHDGRGGARPGHRARQQLQHRRRRVQLHHLQVSPD